MTKRRARVLLSLSLVCGLAICCSLIALALQSGIIGTRNLGDAFGTLVAVYSPNLALLLGALQAGRQENGRASQNSFVLALTLVILWNLLMVLRIAWFASTGFTSREDQLASVLEFWKVAGGVSSVLVAGPIGFYITKKEL